MSQRSLDHAHSAFDFIEALDMLRSVGDVMDRLETALAQFGFENFIVTGLPHPGQHGEAMVLTGKWPKGWLDIYIQENYIEADPVVRWSRRGPEPFDWSQARYDRTAEPRAHEVMARAVGFRMANGYYIPMPGAAGAHAGISMAGVDPDLSSRARLAIRLMGTCAYERIRDLVAPADAGHPKPLTERESEVLTWTALGKTSSEVAEILNLSKRTVDEYAVRAARKLGAQNKTHAVVKALQQKLISL